MGFILDKNYKFEKKFLIYSLTNFLVIFSLLLINAVSINYLQENQKDVTGPLMTGYFSVNEQLINNNSFNIVTTIGIIELLIILCFAFVHLGLDFSFLISIKKSKRNIILFSIFEFIGFIIIYFGFLKKEMFITYIIYRSIIYMVLYHIINNRISFSKFLKSLALSFLDIALLYSLMLATIMVMFLFKEIALKFFFLYLLVYIGYFIFKYYLLNKVYNKKGI